MRVTNNMMSSQLLLNLNRNGVRMNDLQTQLSTGRKLNKPSDDPVGITYSMRYRAELSSNSQHQANVDSALSWLDFNDTVVGQVGGIIQHLKELTVQASNSTNPQSALDSIKTEVEQLKEQLIDLANSKMNGKYIFNGENYDKKPYDFAKDANNLSDTINVGDLLTDSGQINFIVGDSIQLAINTSGNEIFGSPSEKDDDHLFTMIDRLTTALGNGDFPAISGELDKFDTRLDKVMTVRAEIGAKTNRVELMNTRLQDLEINLTDMQAKTEDADYEKVVIQSKIAESIYNASLASGSKIISTSLVDFLR
ncbi:flagellar hook-associated protein FlgL [Paenibacillus sp. D2_2]|uniref:flagellar hook-associated protein FlgL n=1 Tax=Paenibacillus sp. D2_2 TaxID=3073092 RepID=UPI002815700F|nr:flagellar hook-associated protein FlgL [Paenibacillus sp. D2_2]WMT40666.1 flagellar hook-associated protein FlgL [Paenibacillus sp. D2_2]